MEQFIGKPIVLVEYSEHALSHSADAEAICYIQLNIDGERVCGVGRSVDIIQASLDGILGAINVAARNEAEQAA
jgi:2-isopropylmalate synthase